MSDTTMEAMERAVIGALKSAIKDHGPITKDRITSATKRVLGNLANVSAEPVQCTCGRGGMGLPHTVSCPLAGADGEARVVVSAEPTDGGVLVRWNGPCATADLRIDILRAESADGPFNVIAMTANGRSYLDATGKPWHFYRIRAVTPSGPVSLCAHDQLQALGVREIEVIGLMRPHDRALMVETRGLLAQALGEMDNDPRCAVSLRADMRATLAKLDEALSDEHALHLHNANLDEFSGVCFSDGDKGAGVYDSDMVKWLIRNCARQYFERAK